nr:hypothetical protein [Nocardioides alcanivorans]
MRPAPCGRRRPPSRQAGHLGPHGDAQGASPRLHHVEPVHHLGLPTDEATTIARTAKALLTELEPRGGVRLLGVGVSGLADWVQDDLFSFADEQDEEEEPKPEPELPQFFPRGWAPGMDVEHPEHGLRLGVGLGTHRGDGPLRDCGERPRAGAELPDRRPRPATPHLARAGRRAD